MISRKNIKIKKKEIKAAFKSAQCGYIIPVLEVLIYET